MTGGSSTTAAAAPATVALPAEPMAVPIARFRTAYTRGHDTYDDAFSIENANGDFLGECGVGISETLGASRAQERDRLRGVAVRQERHSHHHQGDHERPRFLRRRAEGQAGPQGGAGAGPRSSETIVLETATLIINAEITEMDYGAAATCPTPATSSASPSSCRPGPRKATRRRPGSRARAEDLLSY
jgi:hypothetical protein